MRKNQKNKLKCCALCKPHKRGWANRWKAKDFNTMKVKQKEMDDIIVG